MEWKRRHFMYALGGFLALVGSGFGLNGRLRGRMAFDDWRALPGMKLGLTLDFDDPASLDVDIIARSESGSQCVATMRGASRLDIEIPRVETCDESYFLTAEARDWRGRRCKSDEVEVIAQPYQFGL